MNCKWYCGFENERGALGLGVGRLFIKIPLWDIFGDSRALSTRCHVFYMNFHIVKSLSQVTCSAI